MDAAEGGEVLALLAREGYCIMTSMRLLGTGALAIAVASGFASAQQPQLELPPGRVYAFHSSPQGGCPALDWHVVVEQGGVLAGMISWNNMQSMARTSGNVDTRSGAFRMTATEVGGESRTATIDGTVNPGNGWLSANIQGAGVNCKSIKVPWFTPYQG
jgi:hypothetical protein